MMNKIRHGISYLETTAIVRLLVLSVLVLGPAGSAPANDGPATFRAGAAVVDITPTRLPVIVNGYFNEKVTDEIADRLHARGLVLDDGTNQIAITIVDSCMIPRDLLDDAKRIASAATGIPVSRMLVAATHTHTAPSVHGCLGSDVDIEYARFLSPKIAEAIIEAHKRLAPARVGFGVGRDERHVACRRWLMRPGTVAARTFTGKNQNFVTTHPGFNNPNILRPAGPVDPEVAVLAIQSCDGKPLATLTNYSLHFVGSKGISADYFPVVCQKLAMLLGAESGYVGLHSNGTSGDVFWQNYSLTTPRAENIESIAQGVASAAFEAYQTIQFQDWIPLAMEEQLLEVAVRMPAPEEVREAREVVAALGGKKPRTHEQIYARETVLLDQMPGIRELKLQAIRLGDVGIAAIPNEVFAITGLTIKQRSPLKSTFVIEIANGCEGYIPPPDQHALGGYETWRARTSCLEETAELKITSTALDLLKKVSPKGAVVP